MFWNGYTVHVSATCDTPGDTAASRTATDLDAPHGGPAVDLPNIITNGAATDATVADAAMTEPVHQRLAARGLTPPSTTSTPAPRPPTCSSDRRRRTTTTLVTPLLADSSPQAKTR
jgi:hypothetical protein